MDSLGCIQPLCLEEAASSVGVNQPGSRSTPFAWLFMLGHGIKELNGHLELTSGPLFPISPEQPRVGTQSSVPVAGVAWGGPNPASHYGGEGDAWCLLGRT